MPILTQNNHQFPFPSNDPFIWTNEQSNSKHLFYGFKGKPWVMLFVAAKIFFLRLSLILLSNEIFFKWLSQSWSNTICYTTNLVLQVRNLFFKFVTSNYSQLMDVSTTHN